MPTTAAPTAIRLRRLPFAGMKAFPALFAAYCTDYDRLAGFYAGDWRSPDARRHAAERAAAHQRDHDVLADVLLEQNEHWGLNHATRERIEALRGAETVAVVTGQQVGLLTGPLYTPYKTLTVLKLAHRLAEETGRPVVPVFWLEGGDHDLDEITGLTLLRHNETVSLRYTGHTLPAHSNLGSVGRLKLTPQIDHVLAQIEDALPASDFHEALMAHLHAAYKPGTTLLDAFARLMRAFFPDEGLVFLNADDARFKRLAGPLFRREIEDYETSDARVRAVSETLARGFHAQVKTRPTNLFLCDGDGRHALDAEPASARSGRAPRFTLRDKDKTFTRGELLDLLEADPACFSPNVVLRPVVQDILLPTAVYVAGPSEVSYFAQFKPVYEWAGVPMPVIYPRASVTLVESKVQKVLDKYDLAVSDFGEDLDRLFQRVVLDAMDVDVDGVFKEAARHLHEAVNGLKPRVEQVDRTLVKSAEAARASLLKELDRFKARVVRAEKHNQDEVHAQLAKAQANLFPGGTLQERALSVLYFFNKYGLDLLTALKEQLSLDTSAHQVIEL